MMDAAERALLETTVRGAIADASTAGGASAVIDVALTDLGWLEMLEAEPRDAVDVVFDALGSTNAASSALDDVVAHALGIRARADLAVLLPPFAAWEPPGHSEGKRTHALGLGTARSTAAREIVVVCRAGANICAVTVPGSAAEVRTAHGVDPDARFQIVRVVSDGVVATPLDVTVWESAVAFGRRAVATQMAGASRAMLGLARTHALERVQFGRPVVRFQAVRHRLADALVAIEALEATLAAAGDEPDALTAALAKAVAGRTVRTVAAHCQQVLAGIGFTTDHAFHRFLKRTMALEGVFGSADEIALDLGRQLLAARHVPTLIEL